MTTMRIVRSVATVAAVFVLKLWICAPAASAQETRIRFVLDWAFQGQHAPFTLAVDDGTFARSHLDVTVDRGFGSGDTVSKVASGAYDIGLADLYAMVRFVGQNPGHPLIAVFVVNDKSALSIATMTKTGIATPQDLNGKRIAAPVGDASRQLFPLFAALNHVDQASIRWINVSPELRETMLLRGEADAVSGNAPTVLPNMQAVNVPLDTVRVMAYAQYGVGLFGLALVTRPDWAAQHPDAVRDFIRATVHGHNRMIADPAGAVASVKKRDPLINDRIEEERIHMNLDYAIVTPNVKANGYSSVDGGRLQGTLDAVAPAFGMTAVPAAALVYTDSYLPPRLELKMAP